MKADHIKNLNTGLLLGLAFIFSISLSAQDLTEGFGLLEKGDFKEAYTYFSEKRDRFPDNLTVNICYGRAAGLTGRTREALEVFNRLNDARPGNHEVILNLAEAYLWDNNPSRAIPYYESILTIDSTSASTWVGLANAHFMNKNTPMAYNIVSRALQLDSLNPQAQVSAKYIRLARASELGKNKETMENAFEKLYENLAWKNDDRESLLLKASLEMSNSQYQEAIQTYSKLNDPVSSAPGLARCYYELGTPRKSRKVVREALELDRFNKDLWMTYIRSFLWEKNISSATRVLDSAITRIPTTDPIIAQAKAEIASYSGNYLLASDQYNQVLDTMPGSFNGNLGYANMLFALEMDDHSLLYSQNTLDYFPGQPDAQSLINRVTDKNSLDIGAEYQSGWGMDGTLNSGMTFNASFSPALRHRIGFQISSRSYANIVDIDPINLVVGRINYAHRLSKKIKISASLYSYLDFRNSVDDFYGGQLSLGTPVLKGGWFELGTSRRIQDFNGALLSQQLIGQTFSGKLSKYFNQSGTGIYFDSGVEFLSDGNQKSYGYFSLYRKGRIFKYGLNTMLMSFSQQRPDKYYSPAQFINPSIFLGVDRVALSKNWNVNAEVSLGRQLEGGNWQTSRMARVEFTRQTGTHQLFIKGSHSNFSIQGQMGFSYTEIKAGIRIKLRKPGEKLVRNFSDRIEPVH